MNAAVETGSLSGLVRDSISRHAAAGRIALLGPFGEVSYAALGESIDAFAAAAGEWKITRGELVGILAGRTPRAVALFFGLMQAGACPCFIEPRLAADAVLARMRAVGMQRLAVDRENAGVAAAIEAGGMQVRQLDAVHANVLGLVLNRDRGAEPSSYDYYLTAPEDAKKELAKSGPRRS